MIYLSFSGGQSHAADAWTEKHRQSDSVNGNSTFSSGTGRSRNGCLGETVKTDVECSENSGVWTVVENVEPMIWCLLCNCRCCGDTIGAFKNMYKLLNVSIIKISALYEILSFVVWVRCFCVRFQKYSLKFHTKYLAHLLKDVYSKKRWDFKSC